MSTGQDQTCEKVRVSLDTENKNFSNFSKIVLTEEGNMEPTALKKWNRKITVFDVV